MRTIWLLTYRENAGARQTEYSCLKTHESVLSDFLWLLTAAKPVKVNQQRKWVTQP